MKLTTLVEIDKFPFGIEPTDKILFVGSCFADNIGKRFADDKFDVVVNPFGVMYNPASILHTVERTDVCPDVALFTLGTNHVYRLNETGEIVDNCQKRPQRLFTEEVLSVDDCTEYLSKAIDSLTRRNPDVKIVMTVSPIRYAKYGYHGSRLSKATLLLAANAVVAQYSQAHYFPAYEIMNDELRDYRFYAPDMLHPSDQAVDYIYEQFCLSTLSDLSRKFIADYRPIKAALAHRPFNPDSAEYKAFIADAHRRYDELMKKYNKDNG